MVQAITVLLALLLLVTSAHSSARDRIALVIGNANYEAQPLENPVNDAQDISRMLHRLNFNVTFISNANQQKMESEIQSFGRKLHANSVGLFYFSGHGVQYEGSNYLVPIGSMPRVSAPEHLRYKTVDAGYVLGVMKQSGSGLNMVFLDACRNNPFKSFSRSMNKGLARISGAEGTLIAYSTAPGKVALDGIGRNSPYTEQLLNLMQQPNVPVEILLKDVRRQVKSQTAGKQSPWYEASIDGDFYFATVPMIGGLETDNKKASPFPKTNNESWIFPGSSRRLITDAELSSLNKGELWIARNEIFARHGYIFKTRRGKRYVQSLSGWYKPRNADSSETYRKMNKIEQENIRRIKTYE